MKTIGLVGGFTWCSTITYYRYINELVQSQKGGYHSANILLNSVDYAEVRQLIEESDWKKVSRIICEAAKRTEDAGADCIVLGANTIHQVANEVANAISVPLIHIAQETGRKVKEAGISTVALLGTANTMQLNFFKDSLAEQGVTTIIPSPEEIELINTIICEELRHEKYLEPTRKKLSAVIDSLAGSGADGIILGCTEIPMIIKNEHSPMPLFETTRIHAQAAVDFALA